MTTLGERIKELRTQKKLTQTDLGNVLGVTKVSISGYENSTREPDNESLKKLASYFHVSVDYLIGKSNVKLPSDDGKVDLADAIENPTLFSYQGKEIPPDDWEIIKAIIERNRKE